MCFSFDMSIVLIIVNFANRVKVMFCDFRHIISIYPNNVRLATDTVGLNHQVIAGCDFKQGITISTNILMLSPH
jgi:hypothetical protein